jgi:tetratricopeptide (TPR) repeat protein
VKVGMSEGGRAAVVPGLNRRAAVADLRQALTDAVVAVPAMSQLANRRLLISMIKSGAVDFPEIQEHAEARLHTVEIVLACLNCRGGLRSLVLALEVIAPDVAGTRTARQVVEAANLLGVVAEAEIQKLHELLRAVVRSSSVDWRDLVRGVAPEIADQSTNLVAAFDSLAARTPQPDTVPPALSLVEAAAASVNGGLQRDLEQWFTAQMQRLDIRPDSDSVDSTRDDSSEGKDNPVGASLRVATISDETDNPGSVVEASDGDAMGLVASTGRTPQVEKLPQIWGDIPPKNPHFTGREELLSLLHRQLGSSREAAVLPHTLHGMGGVGKSQVAIEYVHRHSADFDLVWWIPAERPAQILASLTKLAQRLGLEVTPEANNAVPAVQEALSTGKIPYKDWLLVFDNAEQLKDVRSFFPTGGGGKILVTSRNREWANFAKALEVDVFTREESKDLLTTRNVELSALDADRLAAALGDLPLAVEQAAAWYAATGMAVDEYLRLLDDKRLELLEETSSEYPWSVAATFTVSLERLAEENPAAFQLLQVCSFLAPEPIPRELFAGSPVAPIAEQLDETLADTYKLGRAIRAIQRYSLAKFDHRHNTLQMHRLVQAVLIADMAEDIREIRRRGAQTLLANGNPGSPATRSRWERYQGLWPHVVVSHAYEATDPRVRALVFDMVQFLFHWGDHEGCRDLAMLAFARLQADVERADPHALRMAKYLAWIQWVLGDFQAAAELNQRALSLYQTHSTNDDEGTIDAMSNTAASLRSQGRFVEARDLDEQALKTSRRVFGPDDPTTLNAAHSMGVSLRLTGQFVAARELDEDTYRRRSEVFGQNAESSLLTLSNLSIDQRESGDYIGARIRQDDCYQRYLTEFGPQNPAALKAARNLAVARRKAGDHESARRLTEETLGRFARRYGEDYPDTMAAALNLAVDLRHAGELGRARELGEETLERYRSAFTGDHPHTRSAQANLAIVYRQQGDAQRALDTSTAALTVLTDVLGPDHPVTLTCATNLASDLYEIGDAEAAFERDTDTLARSERVLGVEHPSTLACAVNLVLDLRRLGRDAAADKIYGDTMLRFRRSLGDRHPATLNARESLRADCDVDPMPI